MNKYPRYFLANTTMTLRLLKLMKLICQLYSECTWSQKNNNFLKQFICVVGKADSVTCWTVQQRSEKWMHLYARRLCEGSCYHLYQVNFKPCLFCVLTCVAKSPGNFSASFIWKLVQRRNDKINSQQRCTRT